MHTLYFLSRCLRIREISSGRSTIFQKNSTRAPIDFDSISISYLHKTAIYFTFLKFWIIKTSFISVHLEFSFSKKRQMSVMFSCSTNCRLLWPDATAGLLLPKLQKRCKIKSKAQIKIILHRNSHGGIIKLRRLLSHPNFTSTNFHAKWSTPNCTLRECLW